jgi:hypothetical protein
VASDSIVDAAHISNASLYHMTWQWLNVPVMKCGKVTQIEGELNWGLWDRGFVGGNWNFVGSLVLKI